jgi:hypothetical protein
MLSIYMEKSLKVFRAELVFISQNRVTRYRVVLKLLDNLKE